MEGETSPNIHNKFTVITNEIYSLREIILIDKAIIELLSVLRESWESKVEAINEVRDLDTLTMDKLIENFLIYELKKNQEKEIVGKRKKKNMVLKETKRDNFEEENITLITKRFQIMLRSGQSN